MRLIPLSQQFRPPFFGNGRTQKNAVVRFGVKNAHTVTGGFLFVVVGKAFRIDIQAGNRSDDVFDVFRFVNQFVCVKVGKQTRFFTNGVGGWV